MAKNSQTPKKGALISSPSTVEPTVSIKVAKTELTSNTYMRNVNMRISRINHIKSDNESLGLKVGDIYTIEKSDVIATLEKWLKEKPFDYFLIEHDEDKSNIHYHLVIVFKNKNSAMFKTVKNKFPYGDIERCGNTAACVQYLIHKNHPDKYQYDAKDIITNKPGRLEDYLLSKCGYSPKAQFNEIKNKILSGELKACDIDKIDPDIYIKFSRQIKAAFELKKRILLKSPKRTLTVVVIQGPSRIGKSTYARAWAEKNNKTYRYSSAGKNIFDNYLDEDVYILDDWEHSGFRIADFLKLTDPNINVPVPARYRDVLLIADTLFIITNTNFLSWYENEEDCLREAVFKRISCVLTFEATKENLVSSYIKNKIVVDESRTGLDRFHYEPISEPKTFDLKPYIDVDNAVRRFDDDI